MPALLVLALIAVPLVELYVLLQVGQVLGALPTVVLLVVVSALGAALLRREGVRAWRAFQDASSRGGVPTREVADGALLLLAGALLLTPGFVSDALGLLLLLPPVRAAVRSLVLTYAGRRLLRSSGVQGRAGPVRNGKIVDGQVVEGRDPPDHGG